MKLQQLNYLLQIVRQDFNVSATARRLDTSQPGISKQIASLEAELGVRVFERQGRQIMGLTPAGKDILPRAMRILQETQNISSIAAEHAGSHSGSLSIATTHTQARYTLPDVVERFREQYPDVAFHMKLGAPVQIAEMALSREADLVHRDGGASLLSGHGDDALLFLGAVADRTEDTRIGAALAAQHSPACRLPPCHLLVWLLCRLSASESLRPRQDWSQNSASPPRTPT